MNAYRSDLARIHDEGFGELAAAAGYMLAGELKELGWSAGKIVDIGCGSGISARILTDSGYSVEGIDLSEALLEIARSRVPEATFRRESAFGARLPSCVAACAVGEVLNYLFDDGNDDEARLRLFAAVFSALEPGGLFAFDVVGPESARETTGQTFVEGSDWVVLTEKILQGDTLKRRIITFRREGDVYRRDEEMHVQRLIPPATVEAELRESGFRIRRIAGYGRTSFRPGVHGFLAEKPRLTPARMAL